MGFGISEILKWGLARLTGAQRTATVTGVLGETAAGAFVNGAGAAVLTKSGTATVFPGAVTGPASATFSVAAASGQNLSLNAGGGGGNLTLQFAGGVQVTQGVLLGRNGGFGVYLPAGGQIGWGSTGDNTGTNDVALFRGGPGVIEQRNDATAQTSRIFGTWTNASNGRWLNITMSTAGVAAITPTGNGTGASGNVLHISGLPTSNPGPGILWNDAGTVKVGT